MGNLTNIHPLPPAFVSMTAAVLVVAQHTVSTRSNGPIPPMNVFDAFLTCDLSADVAREVVWHYN
jgi:hypothetical protein